MQFKTLLLAGHASQLATASTGANSTAQSQGNVSGIATGQMFATLASSYLQHLSQAAAKVNHTKAAIDLTPWANQNLTKIDPNGASWVNGTFHNATSPNIVRSGVVIEDPFGNKMPLRCRGDSVTKMQQDCTEKAAMYMCHGHGKKKLRVRDNDDEHCKNKTGVIVGGVVGGVGGAGLLAGGGFWGWKVSASGEVITNLASNSATASELSIESIVSDALTKVLSTASDSASSSSVIFVETQPALIFAEMADQGVTEVLPDMIEPGLHMAQNTLQQIDISCQAGTPIQQATTQAIQETISQAPQVLESVEGGSDIADAFVEAEEPLEEYQKLARDPNYQRYIQELSRMEELERANKPPTTPETTNPEPPQNPPEQGDSGNQGEDQSGKGPENSDGTPHKDPSGDNGSSPKEPPHSGDGGNNAGSPGEQDTGNGQGTPPTGPPTGSDPSHNGPPQGGDTGSNNSPPPEQSAGNGQGTPPTGSPKGSDQNANPPPQDGNTGSNGSPPPAEQGPANGQGGPPKGSSGGPPDVSGQPPTNGGSGNSGSPPAGQGSGNGQGTPPTAPPSTIEPGPNPISPAMANLLRDTPHKVRDWDTRWNQKYPKVYTDEMDLFPEDFDWEAAIRFWRKLGDLYRSGNSRGATDAGIECSKRVIRLGEWRNLWQTWRNAQQHPARPPHHPYSIHRTTLPTSPAATAVAPPPASGLPPVSVSGHGISVPHFSATHGPPAPSARPVTLVTRTRPVAIPVTVNHKSTSTSTLRPSTTLIRSTTTITAARVPVTTSVAPRPPPPPPPAPFVEPAPGIPCDPDDRMPNGFTCDRLPGGRDPHHPGGHWELHWDAAIIYQGAKCNHKEKYPFTWQCKTVQRKGNWRLQRGGWGDVPYTCWDNPRGKGCSLRRMREISGEMKLMLLAAA